MTSSLQTLRISHCLADRGHAGQRKPQHLDGEIGVMNGTTRK